MSDASPFSVVHSLPNWLPRTSPWLYNQVHLAPDWLTRHVACITKSNLDQFEVPNIVCLADSPTRMLWELALRRLKMRRHLPFIVDLIRRTGSALVHSHWGDAAWRDMPSVQRTRARHVVTFYGKDVNFLPVQDAVWHERYRSLFAHIDEVYCEGPHMRECIIALGCRPDKVKVHHLGVDVSDIRFEPRLWRRGETLRVLIAASFREKKGIPLSLDALGRLKREGHSLEVTVIGDASEDPRSVVEKERILQAIDRNDLGSNVRMLGYIPYAEVLKAAYHHHLFMSPSITASDGDTEGGAPVAILDMAATGLVIVGSTHCDIPNLIHDGVTGFLAQEGSLNSLHETLDRALDAAPRWEVVARAGRSRVETEFDATTQAHRLAAHYAALLSR